MNPLTLFINAVRALLSIPPLLGRFLISVVRGEPDAVKILEVELPELVFRMSPVLYIMTMIIALVTVMTTGAIDSVVAQLALSIICNIWIFITIVLGVQAHDTRLIQAQSIQYYLLFLGFLQTLIWVLYPDNPKNEPTSVFILFMATFVTFINQKVIRPNVERDNAIPVN